MKDPMHPTTNITQLIKEVFQDHHTNTLHASVIIQEVVDVLQPRISSSWSETYQSVEDEIMNALDKGWLKFRPRKGLILIDDVPPTLPSQKDQAGVFPRPKQK